MYLMSGRIKSVVCQNRHKDRHTTALRLRGQYKIKYSWEKQCKKFEKMILDLVKITDQNDFPLNLRLRGIHFKD